MIQRTGGDIAAEVMMMTTTTAGPFLVVEGATDEKFFRPRVRRGSYISIGSGKTTVESAVTTLEASPKSKDLHFLGVVDEDYDWFIGYVIGSDNIVKTDARDLEGLFFRSNALSSVLAEYANVGAQADLERREGCSLAEMIVSKAQEFGKIRMVNSAGPMVDLSKFRPVRFFQKGWTYDMDEARRVAVRLGVAGSVEELKECVARVTSPTVWHCVRGHDMVDILLGGLLDKLGAKNCDRLGVERLLRQSYSAAEFSTSELFQGIQKWSARKAPLLA